MIVFGEKKHRVGVTFRNQKFGGSPYFPQKGGLRPPFLNTQPPFEEGVPADFFKKRVSSKSSKKVLNKSYSTKIPTAYTNHQIPVAYQYRPDGQYRYRNGMQHYTVLQKQWTTGIK
jgi:hypothetical protein